MSEALISETPKKPNIFLLSLSVATWIVPVILWLIHILIVVPILNTLSGDAQFLTAMQFFMLSGLLMILCLLVSAIVFLNRPSWLNLIPIALNLSWLYYVKVLFYGPTIGNL